MRNSFVNLDYQPDSIDQDQRYYNSQPKVGERSNEYHPEDDNEDSDDRESK